MIEAFGSPAGSSRTIRIWAEVLESNTPPGAPAPPTALIPAAPVPPFAQTP